MTDRIPESDWKKFKRVRELALQRLCERALTETAEIASESSATHHERYLKVFQKMREYDSQINNAFDNMSRSRMVAHFAAIRSMDLVEDSEMELFTQETRDEVESFVQY